MSNKEKDHDQDPEKPVRLRKSLSVPLRLPVQSVHLQTLQLLRQLLSREVRPCRIGGGA